jgi:ribosomal protein S27AE
MQTETWECGDCGHTETAPTDELAGEPVAKTVGEGHREREIETTICPKCSSENWHSESVRDAFIDN